MKSFECLLKLYLDGIEKEHDKKIIANIAYIAYKEGRFDEIVNAKELEVK